MLEYTEGNLQRWNERNLHSLNGFSPLASCIHDCYSYRSLWRIRLSALHVQKLCFYPPHQLEKRDRQIKRAVINENILQSAEHQLVMSEKATQSFAPEEKECALCSTFNCSSKTRSQYSHLLGYISSVLQLGWTAVTRWTAGARIPLAGTPHANF